LHISSFIARHISSFAAIVYLTNMEPVGVRMLFAGHDADDKDIPRILSAVIDYFFDSAKLGANSSRQYVYAIRGWVTG
jgi:hypothetical protein